MDARDAARLIAPGVSGHMWADLGAGRGTFTMALATLLGPAGRVYAVERDATAVEALEKLAQRRGHDERALIKVVRADFATTPLTLQDVDGILMANSLHYVADDQQSPLLARLATKLSERGVLLVVEYDNRPRSRWVPYPVSFDRLTGVARHAGLASPELLGRRESAFGGTMYAAMIRH
jgi:ubiquinone/menaquinone biosynthesis C-methylase UbiE